MSTNAMSAGRAFHIRLRIVVGALIILCLALMALTWLQGPRVRSVTLDANAITHRQNQRLLLHMNQPVSSITAKQVTVTPAVPFTVTSGGNTIALSFSQPLHNAARYRVTVRSNGKHSFNYTFTTPAAHIYYAINTKDSGEIHQKNAQTGRESVVYKGNIVDDFVVLGDKIAISVKYKNDTNLLIIGSTAAAQYTSLDLPQPGSITRMRAAPDGQSFGFLFTASDVHSSINKNLVLYHLGGHLMRVAGLNSAPIQALDWHFTRDSSTILAQLFDSSVLLLNPHRMPIPLGEFSSIGGLTYDDSAVIVGDVQNGVMSLGLKTMQRDQLPKPPGADAYLTVADPLNTTAGYLLHIQVAVDGASSQQLVVDRGGHQTKLYGVDNKDAYITRAELSPNDQYAAISINDNPKNAPRTEIVDTLTSKKLLSVGGNKVHWQN